MRLVSKRNRDEFGNFQPKRHQKEGNFNFKLQHQYLKMKEISVKEFNYKEQHAVIIKVDSEKEQKELFEKLQKMGFKNLKVVSV